MLTGKVFITGGSGTLGKAIIGTAVKENWNCEFTVYARSELRLAELKAKYPHVRATIGDVRDYDRLSAAIIGHDVVIHAAALKRIPECEANPTECIATNVLGSQNVARACITAQVPRCIGISTDKACASITCYGSSKKMLESIFQHAPHGTTVFTLVRYGNVVASNGSVIPLWRDQAAQGKPLTITSRAMTRFWMSERDAVRTIERAATMPDATITVPKMGALSIEAMARTIAPGSDTVERGLRSREKLHEDLVHPDECTLDHDDYWTITPGEAGTGVHYTSKTAWRLTPEQFLAMLHEAEHD